MGVVIKQGIHNTIITYAGVVIGFLNIFFLYQVFLTPEEYGLTSILLSVALIASAFSQFGMTNIIIRYLPYFKNHEEKHNGFLFFVFIISIIGLIITSLIYVLFKSTIISAYTDNAALFVGYFFYVIPLLFFQVWFNIFDTYSKSLLKSVFPTFIRELLIRIIVSIILGLYAMKCIDFYVFMQLFVGAYGLILLVLIIYLYKIDILFLYPNFSLLTKKYVKEILFFGLFSMFSNLSTVLVLNIDRLMLAYFPTGLSGVGVYSVAFFVAAVILIPRRSVNITTYPLISEAWKDNDMNKLQNIYYKTSLNIAAIAFFIFIMIWGNLENIIWILKEEYIGAGSIIIILGFAKMTDAVLGSSTWIIASSRYYIFGTVTQLVMIFLLVLFNFLFIPLYGITGAALATLCVMFIVNMVKFIFIKIMFNMQPFTYKVFLVFVIGFLSLFVSYIMPSADNLLLNVFIKSASVSVIYLPAMYFFKVSEDINGIINSLAKKYLKK